MEKKTCIVTGASSGLGKGTALLLAKLGAEVIMLSRDNERGRLAFREIKQAGKSGRVEWIPADLSSQQSVRDFVKVFKNKYERLDVLFNCAGVLLINRVRTVDGLEGMFAANYLGHFLLTNLLFDSLKTGSPSLVVTISGRRHKEALSEGTNGGTIDFDDLQGKRDFNIAKASKQATLAKIIFTYELARRWEGHGIYACTICPGSTRTNFFSSLPWYARKNFNVKDAQTPEEAAEHFISLADKTSYKEINGKYFEADKNALREANSSEESYNEDLAKRLWEVSEELVGYYFNKRGYSNEA